MVTKKALKHFKNKKKKRERERYQKKKERNKSLGTGDCIKNSGRGYGSIKKERNTISDRK